MTKKDVGKDSVSGPTEAGPEVDNGVNSVPFLNVSSKRLPAEYLDRATTMLYQVGRLKIAGLGNAATTAMKVSFILERLGFVRTAVDIAQKTMPAQKWVPDAKDPQDGQWVDDASKSPRPVPQLIITMTRVNAQV
jgi:hypothetical protein